MQYIFGSSSSSCSGAPVAKAPIIHDTELVFAAGEGDVAGDLYAPAAPESAPYGGVVYKSEACDRVKLVVEYLEGDDCNPCTTPDVLTVVEQEFIIPAGVAGFQLPPGYINSITAQVVDATDAPVASVKGDTISFKSSRAGACGTDVLTLA